MRKILLLAGIILSNTINAQTYFEEDFQGAELTTNHAWNIQDVVEAELTDRTWHHDVFNDEERAKITNYKGGENFEMESWLITPAINLDGITEPTLSFQHTKRYAGADLQLMISTDYDGSSNPVGFTWTDITNLAVMDGNTGSWNMVSSGLVELGAFTGEVYIGYKYTGSNTDGSTYQLDDVFVFEGNGVTEVPTACGATFVFCENFTGGLTNNNNWTVYDVIVQTTTQESWKRKEFDGNGYAECSNFFFGENVEMESWLITPGVDLTDAVTPLFSFDHTKRYAGDDMEVFISINYDGASAPSTATWDNISTMFTLDQDIGAWDLVSSGEADLSAYADETIFIAFKYLGGNNDGSTYQIDNILIDEGAACDIDNSTTVDGITISASAIGVNYQWIDCNDAFAPITGETSQDFTATENGSYAVIITDGACSDTSTCVEVTTVGLPSNTLLNNISLYPNPISSEMHINAAGEVIRSIQVFNTTGKSVFAQSLNTANTIISTSNWESGVYFVNITTQNGNATLKVVK